MNAMNAWQALRPHLPALVAKLRALRPPAYGWWWGAWWPTGASSCPPRRTFGPTPGRGAAPSSWEEWLLERLAFLEEAFPEAVEVEVWGLGGEPPGWSGWPGVGRVREGQLSRTASAPSPDLTGIPPLR